MIMMIILIMKMIMIMIMVENDENDENYVNTLAKVLSLSCDGRKANHINL